MTASARAGGEGAGGRLRPEHELIRGSWESDPGHFPLPLTPAFASLYLPWQAAALEAMFSAFGYLGGAVHSRQVDGLLYFRVAPAGGWTPPPWLAAHAAHFWPFSPAVAARVLRARSRRRGAFHQRVLERWRRDWRRWIEAEHQAVVTLDLAALSNEELATAFRSARDRTDRNVRLHFLLHGAIAPPLYALEQFLRATEATREIPLQDLLAGASPASSAPAQSLAAIAGSLAARPTALARARALGAAAVAADPAAVDASLAEDLRHWFCRYGHRVLGRYEFIEPAVAERPEQIVGRLLSLTEAPRPAEPPETGAAVRLLLPHAVRPRFDALLAEARAAYAVRDDNVVLTYNGSFAVMRYLLLEMGRRWQGRVVDARDDIFFLTAAEIDAALSLAGPADSLELRVTAAARRRTWQRQLAVPPPPATIGPPMVLPAVDGLPRDAAFMTAAIVWYLRAIQALDGGDGAVHPRLLTGLAAAPGRYRGTARVIHGVTEFDRLQEGEVLVCSMTSPAWSAILPLAGALVTEHGGPLSHPAVIAREFGIPTVVGLRAATRLIADGCEIVVDGRTGVVELPA